MSEGERLRALYRRMSEQGEDAHDEDTWKIIEVEMRKVVDAAVNRDAANIIEWWEWNSDQELIAFVAKARRLWNKGNFDAGEAQVGS